MKKNNQYVFWIFDIHSQSVINLLFKKLDFFHHLDYEQLKYELHQTDTEKNIYFNFMTNENISVKTAKDSDNRNILFFSIEYSDNLKPKILELTKLLSQFSK
ncbi:hypothetical protein [Chryseobacterium sp. SIMBA_038]|uniref:hypothetical protein n=1 Tax=Chryseobacterium sp. SIMBA_038 TaxID=3085780 RepID=UPI00397826F6